MLYRLLHAVILFYVFDNVYSSLGDRTPAYRNCLVEECMKEFNCEGPVSSYSWTTFNCSQCRYACMFQTIELYRRANSPVPQFHGKWPMVPIILQWRIFGKFVGVLVMEPASVLFSFLNFVTNYYFLAQLSRIKGLSTGDLRIWKGYCAVGLITWICSSAFHWRDFWLTEYMDYFSAFAYILYALFASVWVTMKTQIHRNSVGKTVYVLLGFALSTIFAAHVQNMMFDFDYGFNMVCCVSISALTTLLYVVNIFLRWRSRRRAMPSDKLLIRILVWTTLSVMLEILDFYPIANSFDAHSLFHLATVPVPVMFLQFLTMRTQEHRDEQLIKDL